MPAKILIVDDDPSLQALTKLRFQKSGFNVLAAGDGNEAVKIAKAEIPDLIILDIILPGIDGTEVAQQLREDERTKKIPIIFLSALEGTEADAVSQSTSGPNLIFGKPVDMQMLLKKVRELIPQV